MKKLILVLFAVVLAVVVAAPVAFATHNNTPTPFNGFRHDATVSKVASIDPPDGTSPHRHIFYCNEAISATITVAQMEAGPTNCARPQAKGGYWIPAIRDASSGVEFVSNRTGLYYQSEKTPGRWMDKSKTVAMPKGMKIIATEQKGDVFWHCGTQNPGPFPSDPGWLDNAPTSCPAGSNGFGLRIRFPECWDGDMVPGPENVVEPNHVNAQGFHTCPASHPKQLPTFTMFPDFLGQDINGAVEIAMGDGAWGSPSSMHADTWQVYSNNVQVDLTKDCIVDPPYVGTRPARCDGNQFYH
jgi:hypothetical protein